MVGLRRSSNIKAKTTAKKIEMAKKAPDPKHFTNKTSEIPVLTTSSNLTSDYIGNITKTKKLNGRKKASLNSRLAIWRLNRKLLFLC